MGPCLSTTRPPHLTPVADEAWAAHAGDDKLTPADAAPQPGRPASPPLPPPPLSIAFLTVDAKGGVTPASVASPAALASLAGIPERDVRLLLPPHPPVHSPSGAPLAGPAMLAHRGRAWAVGLEGVRGVVCEDRVLLLAGPALGGAGALDSGGRPPDAGDPFVADLAARVGRTTKNAASFQAAALDAMCDAVVEGLEVRAAALAADATAAADDLVASATGRGGVGGGGWTSACCCCAAPPPPPHHHPSAAAARLRRVKGEVSDCEAAARRVVGALGRRQARRGRQGGGGGGGGGDDLVAAVLAAASARAAASAGLGGRAAAAARDAEAAARMALRRRALACGGA